MKEKRREKKETPERENGERKGFERNSEWSHTTGQSKYKQT